MTPIEHSRRFCVAPMMRHSHRAARAWWRFLCPSALLYTEMIVAAAVLRGDRLRREAAETHPPVALQLGGCEPRALARAARAGERSGFAEVNLNCGCPSGRVKQAAFGASLMMKPKLVADIVRAMKDAVAVPVTVKCRIAVDDMDPESGLNEFAAAVRDAGADALIVHARKAWLAGLSPAQNRGVPPLDYSRARRLRENFPDWFVVVNGGLQTVSDARRELNFVDGAMLGRAVVRNPMILAEASARIFGAEKIPTRMEALERGLALAAESPREWRMALAPLAGLGHGMKNARAFRGAMARMSPEGGFALSSPDAFAALEGGR